MLSKKAKVLQSLAGKSFLEHILSSAEEISDKVSIVVGFDKNAVEKEAVKILKKAKIFEQKDKESSNPPLKSCILLKLKRAEIRKKIKIPSVFRFPVSSRITSGFSQ